MKFVIYTPHFAFIPKPSLDPHVHEKPQSSNHHQKRTFSIIYTNKQTNKGIGIAEHQEPS